MTDDEVKRGTLRLYDGPPIKYKMKISDGYDLVVERRTQRACGHPWPRECTCMWNEPPRKIVVHLD